MKPCQLLGYLSEDTKWDRCWSMDSMLTSGHDMTMSRCERSLSMMVKGEASQNCLVSFWWVIVCYCDLYRLWVSTCISLYHRLSKISCRHAPLTIYTSSTAPCAEAEVSKWETYRRGWLLWIMDYRAKPLMDLSIYLSIYLSTLVS